MQKGKQLHAGKAKTVYATQDPTLCIISFRDDATALNGLKKGSFDGKGKINNEISCILFTYLEDRGVPTHYVSSLNDCDMLTKLVRIIPLEVIVRNVAAGSFSKRFAVEEGTPLAQPTLEYSLKDDALDDPPINESQAIALGLATAEQFRAIADYAMTINRFLTEFFQQKGLKLIDCKFEFGLTQGGELLLADELSPDNYRLWDAVTNEKMDKDRFRRDMGGFAEAYAQVLSRVKA